MSWALDQNFNHCRSIRCSIKCSNEACTFPKTTLTNLETTGRLWRLLCGERALWRKDAAGAMGKQPAVPPACHRWGTEAANNKSNQLGEFCPTRRQLFKAWKQKRPVHLNPCKRGDTPTKAVPSVGGADGKKHTHCLWILVARGRVNRVYDTQTWILQS